MFCISARVGAPKLALVAGTMLVAQTASAEPRKRVATSIDPTPATTSVADAPIQDGARQRTLASGALTAGFAPEHRAHQQALYVELLGKGGPYGVGYDLQLRGWIGVGAVASFAPIDGQRMYSLTPYVTLYPIGRGHHRLFVDAGPQLTRLSTPSPVPEWKGTSSAGVAAEVSSGYEYRGPVFVRAFGMGVAGKNGFSPWLGLSIGFTL